MGDLWRSKEMQLFQLYVQVEAAHDTVDELGKLGLVQFRDLNSHVNAFQRSFVNEVTRADEMERKLRYFDKQIAEMNEDATAEGFSEIKIDDANDDEKAMKMSMDELESHLSNLEKEVQDMNSNTEAILQNYNKMIECQHVLEKDEVFFQKAGQNEILRDDALESIEEGKLPSLTVKLRSVSGVILRKNYYLFEKILFRATRGNIFIKFSEIAGEIKDPTTGELTKKNVFIAFFQGERIEFKIKKICDSFGANLYPCPEKAEERQGLLAQVKTQIDELRYLIERGWENRTSVLRGIATHLRTWQNHIKKEKAIYHTMNKFNYDVGHKCLIAEGWCPKSSLNQVQLSLRAAQERSGALVSSILNTMNTRDTPPTYFENNKVTQSFQDIVNAYGVARYREINPAVLTIVTFPFQFGIMFGDIGHGFLLLFIALWFLYMERKWGSTAPNEVLSIPYSGRYVLVFMAIFSIYCGAIYNEFFAQPLNIFGSMYQINTTGMTFSTNRDPERYVYPFGVDPVWKGSTNELLYYNSVKMKMSVIIGVTQMTVGLFLKFLNNIHFRDIADIFFETIPQMVFLLSIFGYLVFMIFYKWGTDYYGTHTIDQAPSILNKLILMFVPGGSNGCPQNCPLYPGEQVVQKILVILALSMAPIMIFAKPIYLLVKNKTKGNKYHSLPVNAGDSETEDLLQKEFQGGHGGGHGGHGEEFVFSEIMVHQALESIEFILGSVSHTASYLRLWALSLAHSELATVFWDKFFYQFFEVSLPSPFGYIVKPLIAFGVWSVWFAATIGVIVLMESLSAFLHALRLHWIEFQSKFYKGDGYPFQPFSYELLLKGETDLN